MNMIDKEAIEDAAVNELLRIGVFKQKFCNNEKTKCENVECVIR